MKIKIRNFLIIFFLQCFLFMIFCFNYRAIANANIMWTLISDTILTSTNFFIIKSISTTETTVIYFSGYILGSNLGSVLGIILSKSIF